MKYSFLLPRNAGWVRLAFMLSVLLGFTQAGIPASPASEIYVAGTPCNSPVRSMLSIPHNVDCEFIKWKLLLYKDPRNGSPVRFELKYTYGMAKQGTRGFVNGGTKGEKTGTWELKKYNGKLPGRFLLLLHPQGQESPIAFLKLDANILHLLDKEGNLMIGNAAWSYTMNRTSNPEN